MKEGNGRLLVISRKFPPSVGGTQTVLKNLFASFDREEYFVVHDREGAEVERETEYDDVTVDFPGFLDRILGKLAIPLFVFLLPVIVWRLLRVNRGDNFDRCLIVYPDPFFAVGGYVFCKLVNMDYVLYYHDLFEEAQTKNTRIVQRLLARLFEGPMIQDSDKFLVISGGLEEFYREKWDLEPIVLPHSIDMDIVNEEAKEGFERTGDGSSEEGGRIEILYSGRIYDDQYDAVEAFTKAFRKEDMNVEFVITSSLPREHFEEMGIAREDTTVKFYKTKNGLHRAQREADILYLPLAFDPPAPLEVNTALPTKLFEYMASMSPVLVHCSEETYLYRFCRENDIGYVCNSRDADEITGAIRKLSSSYQVDYDARTRFLKKFSRAKVSREFRKHLGLETSRVTAGDGG